MSDPDPCTYLSAKSPQRISFQPWKCFVCKYLTVGNKHVHFLQGASKNERHFADGISNTGYMKQRQQIPPVQKHENQAGSRADIL